MKKRLMLIPLLGALALTGCDFFTGLFNKSDKAIKELGNSVLKEFKDYKVVTKIKDGGEYLMGVYRKNEDIIRFANGDYHRDAKGYYPFYLGTVGATTEGAATVKVKFEDKTTFSLQMSAPGQVWDGKYIGLYPSHAISRDVVSVALLDSPTQKVYNTITNHQDNNKTSQQVKCYGLFTWFAYYDGKPACAPAITLLHPDTDVDPVPKFLGTGHNPNMETDGQDDYTSMDAQSYETALEVDAYDLMHLYEKK